MCNRKLLSEKWGLGMEKGTGKKLLLFAFVVIFMCTMLLIAAMAVHIIPVGTTAAISRFFAQGEVLLRILVGIAAFLLAAFALVLYIKICAGGHDAEQNIPIGIPGEADNMFISCSTVDNMVEKSVCSNNSVNKVNCRVSDIDINGITLQLKLEVKEGVNMVGLCSEIRSNVIKLIGDITGVKVKDVVISVVSVSEIKRSRSGNNERRLN